MIGIRDGDQRREMEDSVATFHRRAHTVGVAHIAGEHLESSRDIRRARIEPSPGIERIIVAKCSDNAPLGNEPFYQVAPYKSIGASHQCFFSF